MLRMYFLVLLLTHSPDSERGRARPVTSENTRCRGHKERDEKAKEYLTRQKNQTLLNESRTTEKPDRCKLRRRRKITDEGVKTLWGERCDTFVRYPKTIYSGLVLRIFFFVSKSGTTACRMLNLGSGSTAVACAEMSEKIRSQLELPR